MISRSLIDSEVFASEKLLKIWIWLLIKANFTKRSVPVKIGQGQSVINLERGQLLFGRLSAENDLFIDGSTIYKCIKRFEALEMITIKSNSHFSVITICNYDKYQDLNNYKVAAKEQPSNNQVTAAEQLRNTDNKDNNDKKEEDKDIRGLGKKFDLLTDGGWNNDPETYQGIKANYPKLFKMKRPLLYKEHKRLIEKYGIQKVKRIYQDLEGWADLLKKRDWAAGCADTWPRM